MSRVEKFLCQSFLTGLRPDLERHCPLPHYVTAKAPIWHLRFSNGYVRVFSIRWRVAKDVRPPEKANELWIAQKGIENILRKIILYEIGHGCFTPFSFERI